MEATGRDTANTAHDPFLVVRNDNDRPVAVRLYSGGSQVTRLWVAGLARDSSRFRRALVSGGGELRTVIEEGGSKRRTGLRPIYLPPDAGAVVVVVRSVLTLSYPYIR